jgi:hypothetical protein
MMLILERTFTQDELNRFKEFLHLDLSSITWEGRFEKEFTDLWGKLFEENLKLSDIKERFDFLKETSKRGPINKWFSWIEEEFLLFLFLSGDLSIREIADAYHLDISHFSNHLREYFLEMYPARHKQINKIFQISYRAQDQAAYNYEKLKIELSIDGISLKSSKSSQFRSLEVTLFGEWEKILEKMTKTFSEKKLDWRRIKDSANKKTYGRLFLEFLFVFCLGITLIYFVGYLNKIYEQVVVSQIDIYSPKIELLDQDIKFKSEAVASKDFKLGVDEIEKISADSFPDVTFLDEEPREDVESEVVLTSWDSLPQDIASADQAVSQYEEASDDSFRDVSYGNRKVYRVIMESALPVEIRGKIQELLNKYAVTKGDRVAPGTQVPGGVYYNLFVPREFLKEFLAQVTDLEKSRIFESRTRSPNPPGKNKVFIWIKQV